MSEYDHVVERQREMIKAEEWAKGIRSLHAHSLTSMAYDTRGNDGSVTDIEYNDGSIMREISETGEIVWFGKAKTGDDLLNDYRRLT